MYDKAGLKSDLVLNISLNQSVLLEKLVARRVLSYNYRYVKHASKALIFAILIEMDMK